MSGRGSRSFDLRQTLSNPVLEAGMKDPIREFSTVMAVDPGAAGGVAVQKSGDPVTAYSMPPTEAEVMHLLRDLTPEPARCIAFVELVGGFVGKAQPGARAFKFGRGFGFTLGVLQERGVRVELVLPGKWQKNFNWFLDVFSGIAEGGIDRMTARFDDTRRDVFAIAGTRQELASCAHRV